MSWSARISFVPFPISIFSKSTFVFDMSHCFLCWNHSTNRDFHLFSQLSSLLEEALLVFLVIEVYPEAKSKSAWVQSSRSKNLVSTETYPAVSADFRLRINVYSNFQQFLVSNSYNTWKFSLKGCLTSSPCLTWCQTCPGTERENKIQLSFTRRRTWRSDWRSENWE